MRRRLWTGFCAAAVLPLLALALAAPLNAIRCRLTGQILTACCCPEEDRDQPAGIAAANCCERTSVDAVRPPSDLPAPIDMAVPTATARVEAPEAPAAIRLAWTAKRDEAVPRPPLILIKRSFLI